MVSMIKPIRPCLLAGLLAGMAPALWAQDVNLLVRHTSVSLGADGVKRTAEFAERFYRRPQLVWIERVIPEGAHSAEEHAKGHKEHRHLDVTAAARWITSDDKGNPAIRLVSSEDKVVVDVAKTDYGNIGFDGSWIAAYHLLDPAVLQKMTAAKAVGDTTTYTRNDKGAKVTVVWNHKLQYPVSVESVGTGGSRKTWVQPIAAPAVSPWTALKAYQKKDYADYLD